MRDEEKDRMELEKRFKRIDKNSEAKEKNYDENISDKHSLLAVITGALTAPASRRRLSSSWNHEGFSRTVIQVDSVRPDYLAR